ncbi:glycosyltransferase family 4 protein [Mucilaginibacter sp. UR6-11]|uniref:glycosyltransferase family 4 protein n=1 Tax=Mucilaginibacter sp. UR6-11 TaxID=1435644 RepID=UPI001E4E3680|nr:glycosyltransferase family 4 protein [Mucilaginibacter sp. UR6-11]MCC8424859.1 glycosyltransferase family 4 protein [Mucilaginibacter sp. UR6-11]
MKIIFSTDQIFLHGGIEKAIAEKANYFADKLGFEVTILTNQQKGKDPIYKLSDKIQLIDIDIDLAQGKSFYSFCNVKQIPKNYTQIKKVFYNIDPDVVIVCNYGYDFYMIPFLHKKSKKIKEFHSSRYFESTDRHVTKSFFKHSYYKINDWVESKYTHVVVLNKDEVPYYNSNNVVVIPNPISVSNKQALLTCKAVIAAGRIAPVKGFDKLIKAWKIVNLSDPQWELHIYGDDYLQTRQKLEKLIHENGLSSTVIFKGTSSDMTETFLNYSLYAMSSVTECFPMVLLEALSVGLPIVSFDCPNGPRNILTNQEDGLLAQDQNSADLAKKLLVLIQDVEKRKKFGMQAKINSQKFDTATVMKNWVNLFN